ncbi:MAG: polyamine aminopropyltransferase [Gammaproteobacteria bacterium]
MTLDNNWFTEVADDIGSAFSLKIKARLEAVQTPFQNIEIYDTTHYGKLMIIDGYTMVSTVDNFLYHEMMSHPVLYTHPQPEKVLIIGGGDCGTLQQVLKHPEVRLAQQVDIDEQVTRLAEKYFPELCTDNNDPRAELHFADGLKWVKDAADGYYDIIIVDSTDPVGPAEGLFNEAFYRDCRRALGAQGLLCQQSESPLSHVKLIGEMKQAMRAAGFAHTHTFDFPQPLYPSGWWSATMAGADGAFDGFREAAARDKPFATKFYSHARHQVVMEGVPFLNQ